MNDEQCDVYQCSNIATQSVFGTGVCEDHLSGTFRLKTKEPTNSRGDVKEHPGSAGKNIYVIVDQLSERVVALEELAERQVAQIDKLWNAVYDINPGDE